MADEDLLNKRLLEAYRKRLGTINYMRQQSGVDELPDDQKILICKAFEAAGNYFNNEYDREIHSGRQYASTSNIGACKKMALDTLTLMAACVEGNWGSLLSMQRNLILDEVKRQNNLDNIKD